MEKFNHPLMSGDVQSAIFGMTRGVIPAPSPLVGWVYSHAQAYLELPTRRHTTDADGLSSLRRLSPINTVRDPQRLLMFERTTVDI